MIILISFKKVVLMTAWDEIFLVLWVIKEERQLYIVEQEFSIQPEVQV